MQKMLEEDLQMQIMEWSLYKMGLYPELALLYHTPNGGKRSKAEAGRFKAMGVKSGVPDLFLPVPRGGFHGLYIELKIGENTTSDDQDWWIEQLTIQGYKTAVLRDFYDVIRLITGYLDQKELCNG